MENGKAGYVSDPTTFTMSIADGGRQISRLEVLEREQSVPNM